MQNDLSKKRIKEVTEVKDKLQSDLQREPLVEEIASELGLDPEEVREVINYKLEEEEDSDFQFRLKVTIKNHQLEKCRSELELTQEQVAYKLGINKATYCAIESCRTYPNYNRQILISKLYGQPLSKLFPEWLQAFTEKWDRVDKSRIVPVNMLQLTSPEVLKLESGDMEEMERQVDNSLLKKVFTRAFTELTPREQDILKMRFFEGLTLQETGQRFGATQERIRQIEAKAIEKLRHLPEIKVMHNRAMDSSS